MKRTLILLLIGSALGYLVTPQMADGLPPCHCSSNCGWSCQLFSDGWWECEQVYPSAARNKAGQGIETSVSCGTIKMGENCNTVAYYSCGGGAYTTGACDSSL